MWRIRPGFMKERVAISESAANGVASLKGRGERKIEPLRPFEITLPSAPKFTCPVCGSDNVAREAVAEWRAESQRWEVTAPDHAYCRHCHALSWRI